LEKQPELEILQSDDKKEDSFFSNIKLPASIEGFFLYIWGLTNFSGKFFKEIFKPPFEIKEILRQLFEIGYRSLPLVGITGFIIGFTLTLQSIPTLDKFGAKSLIPGMVSIAIIREIGPVITALICAGKIGSGIGAELGSMKVTEQIDAMEVSAINPFRYLVVARILATTLMVPILIFYADGIALLGSFFGISLGGEMTLRLYFTSVVSSLTYGDILPATIKTFFFGFAIGLVGSFEGYTSSRGTESVGKAANSAVVAGSLLVILLDMIAVQITSLFY
jgi:phospholipid/cholesterol/gamma-HCH transport system permease protein